VVPNKYNKYKYNGCSSKIIAWEPAAKICSELGRTQKMKPSVNTGYLITSTAENAGSGVDVFEWDIQFETGIDDIDRQHRKLVQLINSLGRVLVSESEAVAFSKSLFEIFDELTEYVNYHFRCEEELMALHHGDGVHEDAHKSAHAEFIRQVLASRIAANDNPAEVTGKILAFLSKWLMTHIVGTDMRMAKMILALQSGLTEEEAIRQTNSYMSNSSEALLSAMNHLYENLANKTADLLKTKRNLDIEIGMRKQTEAELRKLSGAVEHSPVSILITNSNGEFDYVNPKFTQLTGYRLNELKGQTPRILKSGTMPVSVYQHLWQTISAGQNWHGEIHNRKKNGDLYWDHAAISPIFDSTGNITHYVSIQEDITERKQAEENIRQQKQFSDDIINSLPGIFYMLNPQGRFVRVNRKFMEVTHYSRTEIEQMTALDFFDGDDKNLIAQRMRDGFEQGDSSAEADFVIKSGQKIPYYFTGHRSSIGEQPYLIGLGTDITERRALTTELARQARIDSLTGLSNRRHFIELADIELARAKRYDKPLSVLMLDLDEFKSINDTHGHQSGDRVLRKIGEVCVETLREVDIVGRVGGEEFAVLLPESDANQAADVAERLRQGIANAEILLESAAPLKVTASIGISTLTAIDTTIDKLLHLADKALYEAKRTGRNKVCVSLLE